MTSNLFQANPYLWTREHFLEVITGGKKPLVNSPRLIEAFTVIDRREFLPEAAKNNAYTDSEDEFGFGEVLASPILEAQLLQLLDLNVGHRVLELGTGSGYALALIAYVVSKEGYVFSVERSQQVCQFARKNMESYPNINNFEIIFKDGVDGLISRAPYDRIYAAFAFLEVPEVLVGQLKIGGKMVLPLNNMQIKLIERVSEEDYSEELVAVREVSRMKYGVE